MSSLVAAKAASIGLQVATITLNTAVSMGISLAISAVLSQIFKWIHAQEEARQKAIELTNSYKDQQNSLDSQIEKYKELKRTLNNENLSTNETRSIKEQLLEIQKSLIESYGDEATNIDLVNGKYKEQLGLLSELSKETADEYVKENRSAFEDAKKELEKVHRYTIGPIFSYDDRDGMSDDQKQLYDYIKSYSDLFDVINMYDTSTFINSDHAPTLFVNANADDAKFIIDQLYDDIEKYVKENNLELDYNSLQIDLSKVSSNIEADTALKEYREIYDEFMKAEIVRNDTLRPLYQQSIQAVEDYNNALSSGEDIEVAKANLDKVQQSVQNATYELEGSQEVFDGIYDGINKSAESAYNLGQAFENDKSIKGYAEQLKGLTDNDLKAINFEDKIQSTGEKSFGALIDILGLSEDDVQNLIDKLVEFGYIQAEVQDSASNIEVPTLFSQLTASKESIDQFQSSLKSAYDAYGTLMSDAYSSSDLLDSIQTISQAATDMGGSIDWEFIDGMDASGLCDPLELLGGAIEHVSQKYAESILSDAGIDTGSRFGQMLASGIIQAQKAGAQLEALNGQIDSLQSSYDSLTDIVSAYNETGYLNFDQLQALLAIEPQYLSCLADENGRLCLNEEAMTALANRRLDDAESQAVQQAISELGQLALQDEQKAVEENAQAFTNSVSSLAEYNEELANTVAEASVGAAEIRNLNAAINGAESQGAEEDQIRTVLDNLKTKLQLIRNTRASLSQGMGNILGGKDSSGSAKDAASEYSELFDFFDRRIKALDSSLSLLKANLSSLPGSFAKNSLLDAQISLNEEKINNYSDALALYAEKADEAFAKLPADLAKKVKEGAVSLTTFTGDSGKELTETIKY